MFGTLTNAAAIIAGSTAGILIHTRLPQKYINIVFQGVGLFTLVTGIAMALKSDHMVMIVVSVIAGSLTGEALNIDGNLEKATGYLLKKFVKKGSTSGNTTHLAVEGFITATMLFGVGSMAILGAFEDGMGKSPQLLYAKSIMDGIAAIALASSFGISIAFSAIPIVIYQGALTLFTAYIMRFMTGTMITDLTAVGGLLLVGLGISILKIKNIKVINMLPALVVIILLSFLTT